MFNNFRRFLCVQICKCPVSRRQVVLLNGLMMPSYRKCLPKTGNDEHTRHLCKLVIMKGKLKEKSKRVIKGHVFVQVLITKHLGRLSLFSPITFTTSNYIFHFSCLKKTKCILRLLQKKKNKQKFNDSYKLYSGHSNTFFSHP